MLEFIRARAQGVIAWLIVIAIALTFALWGVSNYLGAGGAGDAVVKVNGTNITKADVQQAKQHVETLLNSQFPGAAQIFDAKQIRAQALNQLIDNALLNRAVYKRGLAVSKEQLLGAVAQLPELQDESTGKFSEEKFQIFLQRSGYSLSQFLDMLQNNVLLNQLQQGLLSSAFALENEAKLAYALDHQRRDIQYVLVKDKDFKSQVKIKNKDIKQYYQSHKSDFVVPEQVNIEYVQLDLKDIVKTIDVSEQQIKQYYQDNQDMFTLPAQYQVAQLLIHVPDEASKEEQEKALATITDITKQAEQGEDFTKLVKQYSEDVASAKQGGLLPWFTLGNKTFDDTFEQTVASLSKGDVSKPVRTSYGYNLIKLVDVKPAQTKPLTEVAKQIKAGLQRQSAEQRFSEHSNDLANLSFENPDSLAAVANALNLEIKTADFFTEQEGGKGISANPKIIEAAFSEDVLRDGNNSEVIELGQQNLVVLRVKDHKAASQRSLKQVKADIENILTAQATDELAAKQAAKLVAQAKTDNTNSSKWETISKLKRDSDKPKPEIVALSFQLNRPSEKQASVGQVKLKNGYAVVKLLKVTDMDVTTLKADDYAQYKSQLEQGLGRTDYLLFSKSLKNQAKLKFYKEKDAGLIDS